MRKITGIALGWLVLLTTAQAASFDCAKASTKIEKLICSDAELSKLDEDLSKAYLKSFERSDIKQKAIRSQRQWLKDRRNACQSAECLKKEYVTRVKEVGLMSSFGIVILSAPDEKAAPTIPSEKSPEKIVVVQPVDTSNVHVITKNKNSNTDNQKAVCRAVADFANQQKLSELVISFSDSIQVDINNDGKNERVVMVDDGTMHWEHLDIFSENGKPIEISKSKEDDWEGGNLRWAMDQLLIRYDGQIYVLGKTDDYLNYLSRINKKNIEKVVCEFAQQEEPDETLVSSSNDKLCQEAFEQQLDYVEFGQTHALTVASVQEAGFYATTPGDFVTQVDINNDGKAESVVQLKLASGAGRGCDSAHLGVLNKERNKLDMIITQLLPERLCGGVVQTPFIYEGQTYVEVLYALGHPTNIHQVVQLKRDKLETICQFDVRIVNYVLGEYERILENAKAANEDPWVHALKMPGTSELQVIMNAKQDIRIKNRNHASFGITAMHEAIQLKRYDALQFLLENGADPNVIASNTPPDDMPTLIFAISEHSIEGMRLLLKHGANPSQKWNGQSAKDWVNIRIRSEPEKAEMLKLLSNGKG